MDSQGLVQLTYAAAIALLPVVTATTGGSDDGAAVAQSSSFGYWLLDSFMWAVALYYILTRRATFVELFQRYMLQQDELSAQIDEIESKAGDLAILYEEIAKQLPHIRGTRHHAKLIGALTALDAATRRMLDSLPLPSSPSHDESVLSVSREDAEVEAVVTAHENDEEADAPKPVHDNAPVSAEAAATTVAVGPQRVELKADDEEKGEHKERPAHDQQQAKEESGKEGEEQSTNEEEEGREELPEDSAGLSHAPDAQTAAEHPLKDDEQEQSEDGEERPAGASLGAANALAAATRRKRRLRSRRSVKCRAGEYDDTALEVDLTRSGSEPDSDASEHRSSDAGGGSGEHLDPSSQFINEDLRMGGSPSRPHHRKKKEKKPKTRNLKRSGKKMGRSKDPIPALFISEENERRDEGYSEEGDGEGEDQRDKLLRELAQAEDESAAHASSRVDLDALRAELDGASLLADESEEDAKDDSEAGQKRSDKDEEEEEEVSDSWRYAKDSDQEESSNGSEAEEGDEKSEFMKLVEEGGLDGGNNDDDDDDDRSSRTGGSEDEGEERSGGEGEGAVGASSLDALKAQLADLDSFALPQSSEALTDSFASLQDQLKGLDGLNFSAEAKNENENENENDERKGPSSPAVPAKSSLSTSAASASKRRSLLDMFDNNYEGSGDSVPTKRPAAERGDGAVWDVAAREDINVPGLRRAKKAPTSFGSVRGGSRKSLRPQYNMEDAHVVAYPFFGDKGSALVAVLDGHAGFEAAQEGARLIPQELKANLEAGKPEDHNLEDIFKRTFASVDAQLKEHEFQGATATAVFVWSDGGKRYLQAANVGDSAAYLRRGSETVKLTYDHKVTDEGERERLTSMGVELSPGATRINGLAVSRALGDHFLKENDLGLISVPYVSEPIELTEEDTLLIVASDGLWDVVPGEEAMKIVDGMDSADDMASCLLRTAVSSSLCADNVTVIVVRL